MAPPAAEPAAHTAGPGAPPPPQAGQPPADVRLEGSEEAPLDAQPEQQVRQEVRVRQMLRIHTHADGSITEEVISEQLLKVRRCPERGTGRTRGTRGGTGVQTWILWYIYAGMGVQVRVVSIPRVPVTLHISR